MKKIHGIAEQGKKTYYWVAEYDAWSFKLLGKCKAYQKGTLTTAAVNLSKKHEMNINASFYTSPPVEAVFEEMLHERLKKMMPDKVKTNDQ